MSMQVDLRRRDPSVQWGFSLQGGTDLDTPLMISSVTPGSLAATHGVQVGAKVIAIGGDVTSSMTRQQAQQAVIRCCNELQLELENPADGQASEYPRQALTNNNPVSGQETAPAEVFPKHSPTASTFHTNPSPMEHRLYAPAPYIGLSNPGPTRVPVRNTNEAVITSGRPSYVPPQRDSMNRSSPFTLPGPVPFAPFYTPRPGATTTEPPQHSFTATTNTASSPGTSWWQGGARSQPAGARPLPTCQKCGRELTGPFVNVSERYFCPEHFVCAQCNVPLSGQKYGEERGHFYCERDFLQFVVPRCAKCNKPITGKVLQALDKCWHPLCFVCAQCGQPLNTFRLEEDGRVLCQDDWSRAHSTVCGKCGQSISEIDQYVEWQDQQFHSGCFCCATCQTPLAGRQFHRKDNKPFCSSHAYPEATSR
ncbi:unnamed protein product [Dicrocoelium dendriticum]|nr:unnamed protein product [Dicrocoelium dendriticum]